MTHRTLSFLHIGSLACACLLVPPIAAPSLALQQVASSLPQSIHDELPELVSQLASSDFDERQTASEKILLHQDAAIPLLEAQRHSSDSELRLQAIRLLQIIERDSLERRIQGFLSLPDATLPGWETYQAIIGNDAAQRAAFATMYRVHPSVMAVASQPDKARREAFSNLLAEHTLLSAPQHEENVNTIDALTFLFATFYIPRQEATDSSVPIGRPPANPESPKAVSLATLSIATQQRMAKLFTSRQAENKIQSLPYKHMLFKTMEHWIAFPDDDLTILPTRLWVAKHHQLAAGCTPATRCLESKEIPPKIRVQAIQLLAGLGDVQHIEILEQQLADETSITRSRLPTNEIQQTQLGDYALAALVKMTAQEYSDFGFQRRQPGRRGGGLLSPTEAGFLTEEARLRSRTKWSEYRNQR